MVVFWHFWTIKKSKVRDPRWRLLGITTQLPRDMEPSFHVPTSRDTCLEAIYTHTVSIWLFKYSTIRRGGFSIRSPVAGSTLTNMSNCTLHLSDTWTLNFVFQKQTKTECFTISVHRGFFFFSASYSWTPQFRKLGGYEKYIVVRNSGSSKSPI